MLMDGLFISGKAGATKSIVCSLALQRNGLPRSLNTILPYVFLEVRAENNICTYDQDWTLALLLP